VALAVVEVTTLDQVYAQVPAIQCQGLCSESCGPLIIDQPERARIIARTGRDIPNLQLTCPALTILGRCSVYADRPLLCRLWGVVESMPCPSGCRPQRYLTDAEGRALLAQARSARA
jgi:hypothetical protein